MPNQNGYFLSKTRSRTTNSSTVDDTIYDSQLAYESTDLEFFENKINSIDLKIPSPRCLNSNAELFSEVNEKMHVSEIDIIYKDDSENVIKVLDTITKEGFESVNSNYIIYQYQSRAPKRVLPEDEITRVSDKVPLKALAQEVSGNRVIYANYVDGHTSNRFLNYQIAAAAKIFYNCSRIWCFKSSDKKRIPKSHFKTEQNLSSWYSFIRQIRKTVRCNIIFIR